MPSGVVDETDLRKETPGTTVGDQQPATALGLSDANGVSDKPPAEALMTMAGIDDHAVQAEGPAYRAMLAALVDDARALEVSLTALRSGDATASEPAAALMTRIGQTCKGCHREHRD